MDLTSELQTELHLFLGPKLTEIQHLANTKAALQSITLKTKTYN